MDEIRENSFGTLCGAEKREEVVGLLLAISMVSRRLAGRLSALGAKAEPESDSEKGGGGK